MPSWLARTPLGRSLYRLRARPEPGALALFSALGAVAATSLSTQVSERPVRALAASHHLRPPSLAAWAWLQVVPKMYSFENQCWFGDAPPAGDARVSAEAFFVNHYPARRLRFDAGRTRLVPDRPTWAVVRSTYQGLRETTTYVVTRRGERLVVERASPEDAPP